jgi:hypothetical protein
MPIPLAEMSKARVCGWSLAGIAGSNPAGNVDVCLLWMYVLSEVFASGRSPVQRSPNDYGVSLCAI